jgi:hypothetical protein
MSTKLMRVGMTSFDFAIGRDLSKARIRYGDLAGVRLDCAEWIVRRLSGGCLRQRVEEGRLADIGQADDAAFETHRVSPSFRIAASACRPSGHWAVPAARSGAPGGCGFVSSRGIFACRLACGFAHGCLSHRNSNLVHETGIVAVDEQVDIVAHAIEQDIEPFPVRFREIAQHVAGDALLGAGMTDAEADAPVVFAAVSIDRLGCRCDRRRRRPFSSAPCRGEIEFVIEDDQRFRLELVVAQRLADRLAGLVHVGLRLEDEDLLASRACLR